MVKRTISYSKGCKSMSGSKAGDKPKGKMVAKYKEGGGVGGIGGGSGVDGSGNRGNGGFSGGGRGAGNGNPGSGGGTKGGGGTGITTGKNTGTSFNNRPKPTKPVGIGRPRPIGAPPPKPVGIAKPAVPKPTPKPPTSPWPSEIMYKRPGTGTNWPGQSTLSGGPNHGARPTGPNSSDMSKNNKGDYGRQKGNGK